MMWLTAIIPMDDIQIVTGQDNGEILYAASKFMHFYMRTNRIKSRQVGTYLINSMYFSFIAGLSAGYGPTATIDVGRISNNNFKENLRYNYKNYLAFNFNKYYVPIYLLPILDIFIQMKCAKFIKEVYADYMLYYKEESSIVVLKNCLGDSVTDTSIVHAITVNILEKNYKYWVLGRCLTNSISIYDL